MTVSRHVAGEHPDLAIRALTRRAGVLARNSARGLALLQKALVPWLSARMQDGAAYELEELGARPDFGSVALGSKERGPAIILLLGESADLPRSCRSIFPSPMLMPNTID